jgi:hypothetical protein
MSIHQPGEPKTFSIIIPVYYNELNLGETIPELLSLAGKLPGYHRNWSASMTALAISRWKFCAIFMPNTPKLSKWLNWRAILAPCRPSWRE